MKLKIALVYSSLFLLLLQCSNSASKKEQLKNNKWDSSIKINGVSFVSPSKEIGQKEVNGPKEALFSNYLSLMPYGFVAKGSTDLVFNSEWQWWGEKTQGINKMIEIAHEGNYDIMLKPHVWKRHGEFTGDHSHDNIEDWQAFEKSFEKYVLHFAEIAENTGIAIFCIGTEWENFVVERPLFWKELIQKVRQKYSGKLTYAANWDEYQKIPFWEDLDFIGVDAYFPLVNDKTPSVKSLESALIPFESQLKIFSDSLQKQILFTEYGYRSKNNSTFKPWESGREGEVNLQAQSNAYQAFYNTFWSKPFIAGGFLWKWFPNTDEFGGLDNNGFTPQNKPVEKIIKSEYSN